MTDNRWDTLQGILGTMYDSDKYREGAEALASLKADYEALLNDRDEWRQGHAETLRAAVDLRAKLERIEGERDRWKGIAEDATSQYSTEMGLRKRIEAERDALRAAIEESLGIAVGWRHFDSSSRPLDLRLQLIEQALTAALGHTTEGAPNVDIPLRETDKPKGYCIRRGCHHHWEQHSGGPCSGIVVSGEPNTAGSDSPCRCRGFVAGTTEGAEPDDPGPIDTAPLLKRLEPENIAKRIRAEGAEP